MHYLRVMDLKCFTIEGVDHNGPFPWFWNSFQLVFLRSQAWPVYLLRSQMGLLARPSELPVETKRHLEGGSRPDGGTGIRFWTTSDHLEKVVIHYGAKRLGARPAP